MEKASLLVVEMENAMPLFESLRGTLLNIKYVRHILLLNAISIHVFRFVLNLLTTVWSRCVEFYIL